jgi:hypothetical protein
VTQTQLNNELLSLSDLSGWGHEGSLENQKGGSPCGARTGARAKLTADFAASEDPVSGPVLVEALGAYESPSDAHSAYEGIEQTLSRCTSYKDKGETIRVGTVELQEKGQASFVVRQAGSTFAADTYIVLVGSQVATVTLLDALQKPDDGQLGELVDKALSKMPGSDSSVSSASSSAVPTISNAATSSAPTVAPVTPPSVPATSVVPSVTGMAKYAALSALQAKGFNVTIVDQPDSRPVDTVIAQDPRGGSRIASGSPVTITVSTGPPTQDSTPPDSSEPTVIPSP